MAVPLAQITLNIPGGHVGSIKPPAQPANPPTAADVTRAVKLKADVAHDLRMGANIPDAEVAAVSYYEADVVLASQIAQVPPALIPAGAPAAPAAPLVAGVALILNAIGALGTAMDLRMAAMERRMDNFQRDLAIASLHMFDISDD
ncbi:hypothetical protein B0H13DRAFT_2393351 [Mycena leptocephala]|nr:hypothetical protein B0H13DRAFT_2393351 [Mycena leptocephala]